MRVKQVRSYATEVLMHDGARFLIIYNRPVGYISRAGTPYRIDVALKGRAAGILQRWLSKNAGPQRHEYLSQMSIEALANSYNLQIGEGNDTKTVPSSRHTVPGN